MTDAQFRNAVQDLVGVRPTSDLVDDGQQGMFLSNFGSPLEAAAVEKYVGAAEEAATKVIPRLKQLVPCDVAAKGEPACARAIIDQLGLLAYRRPLEAAEIATLTTLFQTVRKDNPYDTAAAAVIQALIVSPHFLYVVEPGHPLAAGARAPYAFVTWLSFFLWQRPADRALLGLAGSGALGTTGALRAQVEKMIADPRSREGVVGFFDQWLGIHHLDEAPKNETMFPDFVKQRQAMRDETERFADWVVREGDAKLETLLTASFSFVPPELRGFYGLPASTATGLTRVDLNPTQRKGILTHASFLAAKAHPTQTSIVERGKFVRQGLLCQTPPPPPPDVDDVLPDKPAADSAAERMAHPVCGNCHRMMDPFGLTFEAYDPVGKFRATVDKKPVVTRAEVTSTEDLDGVYADAFALITKLPGSRQVRHCVAEQWTGYALGRAEIPADSCWAGVLDGFANAPQATLRDLIVAIAEAGAAASVSPTR